jgi:hypothetical protein
MAFTQPVDIANRALQIVGARLIETLGDDTKGAQQVAFAYPKLLAAELRRTVWRFATKRAVLRAYTATTKRFIPGAWVLSTDYTIGNVVQDTAGTYWVCMVDNTAADANAPGTYIAGQPQYWQEWFGPIFGDEYADTKCEWLSLSFAILLLSHYYQRDSDEILSLSCVAVRCQPRSEQ